jgi:transposase
LWWNAIRYIYRHEHLFTLRQSLTPYRSYHELIDDCDREIRQQLERIQTPSPTQAPAARSTPTKLSTDGVVKAQLQRTFGVDLTAIPGIRTGIAQTLFGEIGPDFTKFRSAKAKSLGFTLIPLEQVG